MNKIGKLIARFLNKINFGNQSSVQICMLIIVAIGMLPFVLLLVLLLERKQDMLYKTLYKTIAYLDISFTIIVIIAIIGLVISFVLYINWYSWKISLPEITIPVAKKKILENPSLAEYLNPLIEQVRKKDDAISLYNWIDDYDNFMSNEQSIVLQKKDTAQLEKENANIKKRLRLS